MIKVIKSGKIETYVATCRNCGCKFSYQDIDCETILDSHKWTDFIKCPDCGEVFHADKKKLPLYRVDIFRQDSCICTSGWMSREEAEKLIEDDKRLSEGTLTYNLVEQE